MTLAWTLFRAPSLHVAGDLLGRMVGGHFTSATDLGIKRLPGAFGTVALLLGICWAFPNTQQLLERYSPILEPITRRPWFHLRLGFGLGVVLGFGFYLVLRSSFVLEPSPFIYFHF